MANLLSKEPLTQAQAQAEVYVVYNGQDFRMTLATLITLVTKSGLGLDRVNNTADAEKPISSAVAQALSQKANSNAVPTQAAFDALAQSLSGYVTQLQLNTAISQIVGSLNNFTTAQQVISAINDALAPINIAMGQMSDALAAQAQQISAIQLAAANYATKAEVNALTDQQNVLDQAIQALQLGLTNHTHDTTSISGLQAMVEQIVAQSGGSIVIGPGEW